MSAAILLAAGASTRLGEPKQLAMLGSETLLERSVRVAREAGFVPVVVVLGAAAEQIRERCDFGGAAVVVNEAWEEGMASSIRAGLRAVPAAVVGALVMTCDQPAVTAEHLRALASAGEVTASTYAGRRGVPAYFPAALFRELVELRGDAGARELLLAAATVELAGGELDVDTAADLAEAVRRYR
ncbi:MAG TPA: nucleotidyltransferase family protein [Acidobacteriaceae bacterium]|jgi:CTP:molybdopterin cytidylyltransferase MocA